MLLTCEDFRPFSEDFRALPKISEDVLTTLWAPPKLLKRRRLLRQLEHRVVIKGLFGIFLWKLNWSFAINHVLKNNLSGSVSQGWEIILDDWDRCLVSAGARLTHNTWELVGLSLPESSTPPSLPLTLTKITWIIMNKLKGSFKVISDKLSRIRTYHVTLSFAQVN